MAEKCITGETKALPLTIGKQVIGRTKCMTKWTEIFAKSGEDDSACLIGDINEFHETHEEVLHCAEVEIC